MIARNKPYVVLYGKNATLDNISWVTTHCKIDTIYAYAHGKGVTHEAIELADGDVYAYNAEDIRACGLDTSNYVPLPGKLEKTAKTFMRKLHLYNSGQIKYLVMDACECAHIGQLAWVFGMSSYSNMIREDQCYWSWKEVAMVSDLYRYNSFMKYYWWRVQMGDTMYEAHQQAIMHVAAGYVPGGNLGVFGQGQSYNTRKLPPLR